MIMKSICKNQQSQAVDQLIENLQSADAVTRVRAREHLAAAGWLATSKLIELLKDPRKHVRWEAAKTLVDIVDPKAVWALIEAMEDENEDVRWLAAEALIALRKAAVRPLLTALIRRSRSVWLYESAHHVIASWEDTESSAELRHVRDALENMESSARVPVAANLALRHLAKLR